MKKRFTVGTMVIVVLALLISTVVGAFSLYLRQVEGARQNLRELLILADVQAETTAPERLMAAFQTAAPDKRLTLVAADGTVLCDTDSDTVENHADRPEIRQARAEGWGEITRASETLGRPMLYVAKAFSNGIVGRAAMPLSTVDALVWAGVPAFAAAALAALALAFILSRRMARQLVKPLGAVGVALQEALYGRESDVLGQFDEDDELRPLLRDIRQVVSRFEQTLEQVRTERDKVNVILDCMDEGLILLDREDRVLAVNRAAGELLALDPEGKGVLLALGPEGEGVPLLRSDKVTGALAQARRESSPVVLDLNDPSFGGRELRLFISPAFGRRYEGESVGTALLISDVTELKKAENVRSEFTANVSHELKTPLTSIRGSVELLSQGLVKPEDQPRFYTLIQVEVERLISLINDILELSELESVTIARSDGAASPLETAAEVEKLLAVEAEKKNIAIYVGGEAGLARISESHLKELLMNLMENAVRYGREGGGVEVRVSRSGGNMVIAVRDDGIGIPAQAREHVFERFYRVDKGRSRANGGTGLGLAIVKHIAELCGGSVAVDSEPEKGSTFTVTLPEA